MFVRYTFFELATQKGFLMSVFGDLLPRHWARVVTSTPDGQGFVFAASRNDFDVEPTLKIQFTGRGNRESQKMWQERVRDQAILAWEKFCASEAERIAKMKAEHAATVGKKEQEDAERLRKAQAEAEAKAAAALLATTASVLNLEADRTEGASPSPSRKAAKKKATKG